jgi:hypothetical protein
MKAYWGSGGIAPRILDLGTRCMWVVSFTPRSLYPQGKSPWYPLDRRLSGPQSRSGRGVKRKIPSSRRESNPRTPIVKSIVQRYTDTVLMYLRFYEYFLFVELYRPEIYDWILTLLFLQNHFSRKYHAWTLIPTCTSHVTRRQKK